MVTVVEFDNGAGWRIEDPNGFELFRTDSEAEAMEYALALLVDFMVVRS
jgi:hypothetical protein